VVILGCCSKEKMLIGTDISCLVSVGCGSYPPKTIGNCDIDNLLDVKNIHHAPERIKNAVQTLLGCVSLTLLVLILTIITLTGKSRNHFSCE